MSSLVDNLRSSIKKLKTATADAPIPFALLSGTDDPKYVLMLGNDANVKAVTDARKEIGARSRPVTGTCFAHDGTAIFPGLSGGPLGDVKKALKLAGISMPVDSQPADHDDASEAEATESTPASTSSAAKAVDPRIARIDAEVKSLNARLAKADAKASGAQGAKLKISEAGMAYRKGKLDQAEKLLKEADGLLSFLTSKK